jgi:putative SOS response-associated peptidase YedK
LALPEQRDAGALVIADGYYEWRDADKQPFAVGLSNRAADFCHHHTTANELLQPLHARTLVPLSPESSSLGLVKPGQTRGKALLKSYPARAWRFGRSTRATAMPATTVRIYLPRIYSPRLIDELSPGGVITCQQLVYWNDRTGY